MCMVIPAERAGNTRCESERRRRARNSSTNKRLHKLVDLLRQVKELADDLSEEVVGGSLGGYMSVGESLGLQEDLLVTAWQANMSIGCIDSITLEPDSK